MRELKVEELPHVYGAGGRGRKCGGRKKHAKRNGSGSNGSGSKGKRRGSS